jgi:hypothetical protein
VLIRYACGPTQGSDAGGDGLGGLEPRAAVRDEADLGEDLIRLDHDLIGAVDPLFPRRTIPGMAHRGSVTPRAISARLAAGDQHS